MRGLSVLPALVPPTSPAPLDDVVHGVGRLPDLVATQRVVVALLGHQAVKVHAAAAATARAVFAAAAAAVAAATLAALRAHVGGLRVVLEATTGGAVIAAVV